MTKQKRELPNKEFSIAFNKCIKEGIRIYPVPTSNGGGSSMNKGAKKRKASVKIIVDYGTKQIESSETYTQEDDMTSKIIELYKHIAKTL